MSDYNQTLEQRLTTIKENANFLQERYHVRDGVILHLFVQHEAFD